MWHLTSDLTSWGVRLPRIINHVVCLCDRPATLSPYSKIRCEPLNYTMNVMLKKEGTVDYVHAEESFPLACVSISPIAERLEEDEDFMIPMKAALE
ncbi:hypothetical protein L596_015470 [Steinernema carpocapsae]|uniref:Uncharacterized protein n=1 Tax=Steinernema carpocapsae TaxID=34508 RepID=A0A4U5NF32_STECR|nr:hypothetical protein L596_015470 [Steinernema carpocapsae]